MKHPETPGSLLTPLELQHKKSGCDKEIVQEFVSEWLRKVFKRYTQKKFRVSALEREKRDSTAPVRADRRSIAPKFIQKPTNNMFSVQVASNDVACHVVFEK